MPPNEADGIANSEDPDQTASDQDLHCALFAKICRIITATEISKKQVQLVVSKHAET